MKRVILIPIVLFVVLLGFLAAGLKHDPHSIPSPLIDKPAPAFKVPQLSSVDAASTTASTAASTTQNTVPKAVPSTAPGTVKSTTPGITASAAATIAATPATPGAFSPTDMHGSVWMLNVWASWCVSCREEHPLLVEFSRSHAVPLIGLDYKDTPAEANHWLQRFGNPYKLVAVDADGRVGMDYGVYGVPETYVIDREGIIRYKQIGPLTQDILDQTILPLIQKLSS